MDPFKNFCNCFLLADPVVTAQTPPLAQTRPRVQTRPRPRAHFGNLNN
jgi:hypothetical protein